MAIRKKPLQKVTSRINDMLGFIIAIYIMFTGMQMWLLFGTINKALYLYNTEIDVQNTFKAENLSIAIKAAFSC